MHAYKDVINVHLIVFNIILYIITKGAKEKFFFEYCVINKVYMYV